MQACSTAVVNAEEIRRLLKLEPLEFEGGYFAETYKSKHRIQVSALPSGYSAARALGTAIYYLLTPDTCSRMHRLPGDEIFHFYLGDPVEVLQLSPNGRGEVIVLGHDLWGGMKPQHVVPATHWQGSRLRPGGRFALLGTTMAPGFERQDYESGMRADLLRSYPAFADLIVQLTPP